MAPYTVTSPRDFGDPDSEPDVTYPQIEGMVARFIQKRAQQGAAAIDPDILLINRTLAASAAISRRLRDFPEESTDIAFSWVWSLFKPMLVRDCLFASSPL